MIIMMFLFKEYIYINILLVIVFLLFLCLFGIGSAMVLAEFNCFNITINLNNYTAFSMIMESIVGTQNKIRQSLYMTIT